MNLYSFLDSKKKELQNDKVVFLNLKIKTNSSKNQFTEILDNQIVKLDIRAKPISGKANEEIISFLSEYFVIPKKNITILKGKKYNYKIIKISKQLHL